MLAQPLTQLLKKRNYTWTEATQVAFEYLKQAVVTTPILALQDFELTFEVESDASNSGIGVVLSQAGRPIAFYNKALAPKHQVLPAYEKEMVVVLSIVKKWHAYLVGKHF